MNADTPKVRVPPIPWTRRRTFPLYLASLVALLVTLGVDGVHEWVVRAAFAVNFTAGAAWVVAQYRARSGETFRGWWPLLLLPVGIGLFFASLAAEVDGLGVIGLTTSYLAAGSLVHRLRKHPRMTLRWGLLLLTLPVLLFVAAASQFPHGRPRWAVWLAVLAIVSIPVGLNVVFERLLQALQSPNVGARSSRLIVGGICLLLATGVLTAMVSRHTPRWAIVAILAVLFVIVGSIMSTTQADVVVVVLVLAAFSWVSDPAQFDEVHTPEKGETVLLALGDSYMSGEGANQFFEGTNDANGNQCRQAPGAYAVEVVEAGDYFDDLAFLACSGARAEHLHSTSQVKGELPQLAELSRRQAQNPFTVKLAIVSLGGNDSGFSTIGMMCAAPGDCDHRRELWEDEQQLTLLRRSLREAYGKIREAVGGDVPVLVVPYPEPVAGGSAPCNQTLLSQSERTFLVDFARALNNQVRLAAEDAGFWYLSEMTTALYPTTSSKGLRLCDDNDDKPGVNFVGLRSVEGAREQAMNPAKWFHNSLHPNGRGHDAMRDVFVAWLAAHPELRVVPDTGRGTAAPTGQLPKLEPPCSLTESSDEGCKAIASNWIARQTLVLLPALFDFLLIAVTGAALIWFGLIALLLPRELESDAGTASLAGGAEGTLTDNA